MFGGVVGCCAEAVFETCEAASAPFRLVFQSDSAFQPLFMLSYPEISVISLPPTCSLIPCGDFCIVLFPSIFSVQVHYRHPDFPRIPHYLIFPLEILLLGEDVGVVEEDGRFIAVLPHPFEDGGGAGGATGVQKYFFHWIGAGILYFCKNIEKYGK